MSFNFLWWFRHLNYIHYLKDLGIIVRIDKLPFGEVLIRKCLKCNRLFVDFGSGL